MTMEDLIKKFMETKENDPLNVDELLDFIQSRYLKDELTIVHYRNLFRELDAKGAKKPDYFMKEMIS